ncbi:hypothetical protein HZA97_02845 [Candidatus Woesearchaeota archaeon]|nr:hypothetical protein [Candidatus Woesearchaeota archaeon]
MGVVHHIDIKYKNEKLSKLFMKFFDELKIADFEIDSITVSEPTNDLDPNSISTDKLFELIKDTDFLAINFGGEENCSGTLYFHKDQISIWFETFVFYEGTTNSLRRFFKIVEEIISKNSLESAYLQDGEQFVHSKSFSENFLKELFSAFDKFKRNSYE